MSLDNIKLTESQINTIKITLRVLEERLDEINELCEFKKRRGILYRIKNNLSKEDVEQIKSEIVDMKGIIGRIAKQWNMESAENDIRKAISGYLSISWADLCEIESKGLRAYGDVDESVKKKLDPVIGQLIKSVNEISRLIR